MVINFVDRKGEQRKIKFKQVSYLDEARHLTITSSKWILLDKKTTKTSGVSTRRQALVDTTIDSGVPVIRQSSSYPIPQENLVKGEYEKYFGHLKFPYIRDGRLGEARRKKKAPSFKNITHEF